MSNEQSGRYALAGFLYQILGMASIISGESSPIDIKSDKVDALITTNIYEDLQAYHEKFQDAFFKMDDECVIVQFKYSTTSNKIDKSEAKEIVEKLDKSAKQAELQEQNVTSCVLITNREFTRRGGAAKKYWETKQSCNRSYKLRKVYRSITDLKKRFQKFGKEYGLFDQEIEEGIDKLIGKIFRQTGELLDTPINKEDLVESFTGCKEARPITIDRISESSRKELDEFGKTIGVKQWNENLVEREIFDDVIQKISERALVCLYGPGGCGKSVLLWQLLNNLQTNGCCTIKSASDLRESWIIDTVNYWRNLPSWKHTDDSKEKAIERLRIANNSCHKTIIWLALDGVDEGVEHANRESNIKEILKWFWEKDCKREEDYPSATLIVSCREKDDLYEKWLSIYYSRESPSTVQVEDFSEFELKKALRKKFPELYNKIHRRSGAQSTILDDYSPKVLGLSSPTYQHSTDVSVLNSLQHPAMWSALLMLNRSDQIGAIKGKRKSVYSLVHEFIKRFHWKLNRRKPKFRNLKEDSYLVDILKAIAQNSKKEATNHRDKNWVESACQTDHVNRGEAQMLYEEAVSAGLIRKTDANLKWQWRHGIVYDFLKDN